VYVVAQDRLPFSVIAGDGPLRQIAIHVSPRFEE
jgi:hypothetical protein